MTQILNLPLLTFPVSIANNEDWADSWAYVDVSSDPISLAGLTLTMMMMMMRTRATDSTVQIVAASVSGDVNGLPQNGSITSGGAGLNVVGLAIPKATVARLSPRGIRLRGPGLR